MLPAANTLATPRPWGIGFKRCMAVCGGAAAAGRFELIGTAGLAQSPKAMTISPALRLYASTFVERRGLATVDVGAPGCTSFVWNESLVVNLTEDATGEFIHALTHAGCIPRDGLAIDDSAEPDRWVEHHHAVDGFEWMTACHLESGNVVLVSGLSTAMLDHTTFDEWLSRYLERLGIAASVFRPRQDR